MRSVDLVSVAALVRLGVVGISLGLTTACAPMRVGPPIVTDAPLASAERSKPNGTTVASVHQIGTHVTARLADLCDVQRFDTIERTTVREHVNDAPQNDVWAVVGGSGLAAAGGLAVVSPQSVRSDDRTMSDTEIRNVGYVLIGVGALLLATPIVDAIRVHQVAERRVERVEAAGPILQRRVACGAPPPPRDVVAESPDGRRSIVGRTDRDGVVVADLDRVLPTDWLFAAGTPIVLRSEGLVIGHASFAPVYAGRAAEAWRATAMSTCSTGLDDDACAVEERYVARYPDGEHADEARRAIEASAARRRLAQDDEAWAALDARACKRPTPRTADTILTACMPLSKYLDDFPDGRHADAARDAMGSADVVYQSLQRETVARASADSVASGEFIPYAETAEAGRHAPTEWFRILADAGRAPVTVG